MGGGPVGNIHLYGVGKGAGCGRLVGFFLGAHSQDALVIQKCATRCVYPAR